MLPPYTVNEKLVKDIQADSVAAVGQQLRKQQALIGAHFLQDCQQTRLDLGPLSGFVRPPVTLVLTPLGFAVLFDSGRVARHLLGLGASPADRAFLADRPAAGGKARVVELPTGGLALPGRDMFRLLCAFGLDPNAHVPLRLRCCGGGCGGPVDELAPGFWHLLWRCWAPMRDCDALARTTDLLLRAGADANADLAGLMVMREAFFFDGHQFEDRATALKAARYLRMLLLAGCRPHRLGRPEDVAGVLHAVWRTLRRPPPAPPTPVDDEDGEAVCRGLADCLSACWPELADRLQAMSSTTGAQQSGDLCSRRRDHHRQPTSLRVAAALAVRDALGGRHFLRRLCAVPALDANLKLLVRWPAPPASKLPPPSRWPAVGGGLRQVAPPPSSGPPADFGGCGC